MSVWQTPQPAISISTSSGESSPRAVSPQRNWPLATIVRPVLVAGTESALCAGRAVVIGGLHTHKFERAFENNEQGYLGSGIEEVIEITPACDLMAGSVLPAGAIRQRSGSLGIQNNPRKRRNGPC